MKKFCIQNYIVLAALLIFVNYVGLFTHIFEIDYAHFVNYSWTKQNFGNKSDPVACVTGNFIHTAAEKCNESSYITFIVKSAIENANRRDVIRRTWGLENRFSDLRIKLVFAIGVNLDFENMKEIEFEYLKYKDIIQGNFVDNYFNNTIKIMMSMKWAVEFCSNTKFFMFVDDDYYVSLKNVLKFLRRQVLKKHYSKINKGEPKDGHLFAGFVMQSSPHRHKFSKWYISLEEYPFNLWPPYITAGAFIVDRETLLVLYGGSLHTHCFRFDDIFLGLVSLNSGIDLTHCDMFCFQKPKFTGSYSYKYILASHGFGNSAEMEQVWNECRAAGYA